MIHCAAVVRREAKGKHGAIAAIGTCVGEERIDAKALAHRLGVDDADVERSRGSLSLHLSTRSASELACLAASRCLEQAATPPSDVDVIIFGSSCRWRIEEGRRELHLQALLGATNATAVAVDARSCADLVTALRLAASYLVDGARNVVVAFGEAWKERRLFGFDAKTQQPIFSDGGAALLVRAEGRHSILGFGEATAGTHWDFAARLETGAGHGPVTGEGAWAGMSASRVQLMVDSVQIHRRALATCLARTGLAPADIHHVISTREGPRVPNVFMRQLGLAESTYFAWPDGPSHVGLPDCVLALEALLASGAGRRDQNVLLAARAVGTMQLALLRLEESPS